MHGRILELADGDVKLAGGRCQDVPKLPGIGCLFLAPHLDALRTGNWGASLFSSSRRLVQVIFTEPASVPFDYSTKRGRSLIPFDLLAKSRDGLDYPGFVRFD